MIKNCLNNTHWINYFEEDLNFASLFMTAKQKTVKNQEMQKGSILVKWLLY